MGRLVLRGVRLVKPPQTNATLIAVYPVTKAGEWDSARSTAAARWTGAEPMYFRQKTRRETVGTSEDSGSNRNIKFMAEVRKTREAYLRQGGVNPQENEVISYRLQGDETVYTARVLAVNVYRMGHLSSSRHLQLQAA